MLFGLLTFPVGFLVRLVPDRMVLGLSVGIVSIWRILLGPISRRCHGFLHGCFPAMLRLRKDREEPSLHTAPSTIISVPEGDQSILSKPAFGSGRAEGGDSFDLLRAMNGAMFGTTDRVHGLEVHPDTRKDDMVVGRREEV